MTQGDKKPVYTDDFADVMKGLSSGSAMIPDYTQFVKHDAMPNKKEDSPAPSEASIASSTPVMSGATVDIRKSPDRASVVGPSAEELKRQLEKFVLDVQNDDSLSHEEKKKKKKKKKNPRIL